MRLIQRSFSCLFLALFLTLLSWQAAFASGESVTYSYDNHHRLIAAEYSSGLSVEYGYDLTNNLISQSTTSPTPHTAKTTGREVPLSVPFDGTSATAQLASQPTQVPTIPY